VLIAPVNSKEDFYESTILRQWRASRHGEELRKSDSTLRGTRLVKDINPGPASEELNELMAVRHRLFFEAADGRHGLELWKSGLSGHTELVKDIKPGPKGSNPRRLADVKGKLYFRARDGQHGREPWKSNSRTSGTKLVQDIAPGRASSDPSEFTAVKGYVFFTADDGRTGQELWAAPLPLRHHHH
jgi:ELWxxDGT repeat protein